MVLYSAIHSNLTERIDELEGEILKRQGKMCKIEAKVFHDQLLALKERLIASEIQFETNVTDYTYLTTHLRALRSYHQKIVDLQINLTRIFSPIASTTKTEVNYPSRNIHSEQPEIVDKLSARIQKQKFLTKQIELVETNDDICPAKAEVLYNHLGQLFDTFISNQAEIEMLVSDASTLVAQQKIAADVQRKVVDFQTQFNKIITSPMAPKSSAKFVTDDEAETIVTQTDSDANLDLLFKKRESTMNRIASLEQHGNLCAQKAEILYQHLTPLYQSFISVQNEIETLVSGSLLEAQQEISKQIQNKVIELQTRFKTVFAPIAPSSTTELKACSNLIALFNDLFISDQNSNGNRTTQHNQLEITRDMHRKVNCLQWTLNKILSSPAVSSFLAEFNVNEPSSQAETSPQTSVADDNDNKLNTGFKRPRTSITDNSFS